MAKHNLPNIRHPQSGESKGTQIHRRNSPKGRSDGTKIHTRIPKAAGSRDYADVTGEFKGDRPHGPQPSEVRRTDKATKPKSVGSGAVPIVPGKARGTTGLGQKPGRLY